uniref:Serine/threonine-protein phosphatase 7 long form homolog n=1 Tax=Nicotiana sylvestris TaxID=4096 RepID=A0A1U7YGT8_NICSY|nr:PREDICTED: serine/threonine-protein phosphatase 7 long form homolog [Nicotiana sylvestris]
MDVPHVHPGPFSDKILVLQGDHRSAYVWEGELVEQTLRARRVDDVWDFMGERVFHPRVVQRLRDTGFYRIFEIGLLQLDWSLITALIERWRPETHTFHLPIGEATITLRDVQFTGFRPQGEAIASGGSRISVIAIRQHLEVLHPDITSETDDLHIHRYTRLALLLLFGGVLFPNTSGNLVNMRFIHHLQQLDELPQCSWGVVVLVYLYRSMCRASMGTQSDVCGLLPLLQMTTYSNTLDVLDMLEAAQFIWTPYNGDLIAGLPDYCSVGRLIWSTSVPLMCLDIVEHHVIERVLRQLDYLQTIPRKPTWEATHYQRDDRSRADDAFVAWLEKQIQAATTEIYTSWYLRITRLMIGNPVHQAGGRYRPYAGRHESLAIGHHLFYQLGLQMQQHVDNPVVTEYGRQVVELALQTLQAREDERLYHTVEYVEPEHHHRGRHVARPRGWARSRASPRGRSGYIPQQDDPSSSMSSYSLQLKLPASQVIPSDPLLITGTFDEDVEQFFSGPSTATKDRPTQDVDGGCRLSFGSSPTVMEDLSQAQASSQPIMEPTLCDDEDTTDAYIQEPDETMVADGPTTPSTVLPALLMIIL